jgi:hypothetical protein
VLEARSKRRERQALLPRFFRRASSAGDGLVDGVEQAGGRAQ